MHTRVTQWGGSLGIRLPNAFAKVLDIKAGQAVNVELEDNHLIIRKRRSLEEFVAQITPENRHKEIDWGNPVGKEIW